MHQDEQSAADIQEPTVWPPPPKGQPDLSGSRRLWWAELFAAPDGAASTGEVWRWWQARRLAYNKLVFGLGVPSFILYMFFIINSGQLPPGEDPIEPMLIITAPVLAPLVVNVCYTLGVIGELLWRGLSGDRTRRSGRFLMRVGIGITLFVTLSPSVTWGLVWFWHRVIVRG